MRQVLRCVCLVMVLTAAGFAFNRNDFVCGPDGKPAGDISDDGEALGCLLKLGACVAAGSTGNSSSIHFDP
jgi:hypothetical protein